MQQASAAAAAAAAAAADCPCSRGLKLHMPPLAQGLAKCFGHTR